MNSRQSSLNFNFLAEHDPMFLQLATAAELAFANDPNTTLIKLRQLGEAMAQHIATVSGIEFDDQTTQADLLYKLGRELSLDYTVRHLFKTLRIEGNKATHQFKSQHQEALDVLKLARELAVWFHRAFSRQAQTFTPPPFVEPSNVLDALIQAKLEAELEQQQRAYETKLHDLQQQLAQQDDAAKNSQKQQITQQTNSASQQVVLDEAQTRILIDLQLIEAGWQADSVALHYQKGTRPEKGKNLAIAEWPTSFEGQAGRADYVLFAGLTPISVVEAKKENVNVAGKIPQAERYSKGMSILPPLVGAWELAGATIAWPDEGEAHYKVPFVYSCNGRPYVPQLAEQSGIWFRDVRQHSNLKRALPEFHTPAGLLDLLKRDKEKAEQLLANESFAYLKIRDYQQKAIVAVENALADDKRMALLAMATGTGKTRTILGLMYRFLKTERFKRILFLVDRTALGSQAVDSFKDVTLEANLSLAKHYNISELGDMAAEAETRVQVATVQAMVKRIFMSDSPPSIDQFDCIIVDEAHRGYTLDQEMTEGELATRDAAQYLSSYRRVLDYFDAVKIGLTATPAKHTTDIFGHPVYTYSYREAVADDWLIDHEPPIRYQTQLSKHGIHFDKGEQVQAINMQTGEIETADLEDELDFDVSVFNRRVINEDFNRVICEELAKELDPTGEEKTMIFCATDLHADMVKRLLDAAFKDVWGDEYNQAAVAKITGQSDKVDQLIRQYKNERYPNIAITVDLLTTGIDVPTICNLVFMRRVKSRILYEQMIGRATRRCDDIGKTVFRIYDPVDIYASLQAVNTMKPLVKDPNITLEQLVEELTNPTKLQTALQTTGEKQGESHADVVLSQLTQKLMRVLRKADNKADKRPAIKQALHELQQRVGIEPKTLHQHLHQLGPIKAAEFLGKHTGLIQQVNEISNLLGSEYKPILSDHEDTLIAREQNYGDYNRPQDYLESFNHFIKKQLNESAALSVVVNRPRDLSREQLKEIKLLLDGAGYSEAKLQAAVRNETNQDIAASIIGHIRRAALGEPLIPFAQRVETAMQRIYTSQAWSIPQRKWLDRLAKQLVHEVVLDRQFVNHRFADDGGAKHLDKILNNQLDQLLNSLNEAIWPVPQAA